MGRPITSVATSNVFRPHGAKQELAIFSPAPIVILACGIQFGKTECGAMRTKRAMHTHTDKSDAFLITAPTYKIMMQATLPKFLHYMKGLGEWHKGDAVFEMYRGGTCYMRTATDPDSVVGITNVRHIWGDEAGLFPLYFHENLQARASFLEAPICYTTSPYSLNWVFKDYIRPWLKNGKQLADCEIIQARSDENPYFPRAEFERKKKSMDPRRFNMVYGGEFHKMEGLVYQNFVDDGHVVAPHSFPTGTVFIAGVDWGYTNPAAIMVLAVTPEDGVFLVSEFCKTSHTITQLVDVAKGMQKTFNIEQFYCDPSAPANIQEFNVAGLCAIPADNDIRPGVDALCELIGLDKFHVFKDRCPNFMDEISIYHYPMDKDINADTNIKDQLPVKQYDHTLDAVRYVIYALKQSCKILSNGLNKRKPDAPDLRHHAADHLLLQNVEEYDW